MEKKRISTKVAVAVLVILLIIVSYLGVRNIQLNREIERYDYAWAVDLLETNLNLYLQDFGIEVYDYYQGEGYLGLYEVAYIAYLVPINAMEYLDDQMESLGWDEYTSDMYESLSDEHSVWKGFLSISEVNSKTERGYVFFKETGLKLTYSDGRNSFKADDVMLFYDSVTGRLYFYAQKEQLYLH